SVAIATAPPVAGVVGEGACVVTMTVGAGWGVGLLKKTAMPAVTPNAPNATTIPTMAQFGPLLRGMTTVGAATPDEGGSARGEGTGALIANGSEISSGSS